MKSSLFPAKFRLLALLLLATGSLLISSCQKDDVTYVTPDYSAADDAAIQKYLADNKITSAQKQSTGLYFVPTVNNPSGVAATSGTTVSVLYTGKLLNGTVFDATSQRGNQPFTFIVGSGSTIAGFNQGVSLMRKGEKATLLLPSALAYGPRGAGSIPPNTPLIFDIEVVDVK